MEMDILGIVFCSCGRRVDGVIVPARNQCTNHLGLENQKTPEGREERCHLTNGNWTYPTTNLHEIPPSSFQGKLFADRLTEFRCCWAIQLSSSCQCILTSSCISKTSLMSILYSF